MEMSNKDKDNVEFTPRKAIKLEDAVNSAGNCSRVVTHLFLASLWLLLPILFVNDIAHLPSVF